MKYKTNATKAKEHVREILKENSVVPISLQYLNGEIETIVLDTTYDELSLYLSNDNYLRPGYECIDDKLTLATLFTKVNGIDFNIDEFVDSECKNTFYYKDTTQSNFLRYFKKKATMEDFKKKLYPLKTEYQNHIIEKLKTLLESSDQYFQESKLNLNSNMILDAVCKIDDEIFERYNNCDLQYSSPKIIFNLSKRLLESDDIIALLLLNLIGCDVVIFNSKGKADIENYISDSYIDVHHKEQTTSIIPRAKSPRKLLIISGLVIVITLLTLALKLI